MLPNLAAVARVPSLQAFPDHGYIQDRTRARMPLHICSASSGVAARRPRAHTLRPGWRLRASSGCSLPGKEYRGSPFGRLAQHHSYDHPDKPCRILGEATRRAHARTEFHCGASRPTRARQAFGNASCIPIPAHYARRSCQRTGRPQVGEQKVQSSSWSLRRGGLSRVRTAFRPSYDELAVFARLHPMLTQCVETLHHGPYPRLPITANRCTRAAGRPPVEPVVLHLCVDAHTRDHEFHQHATSATRWLAGTAPSQGGRHHCCCRLDVRVHDASWRCAWHCQPHVAAWHVSAICYCAPQVPARCGASLFTATSTVGAYTLPTRSRSPSSLIWTSDQSCSIAKSLHGSVFTRL